MYIAVVDSGANLEAFHRVDSVWGESIVIATKKAKTTVCLGISTGRIGNLS
jgi:uncharacterized protein GlcG (DUF336 family)